MAEFDWDEWNLDHIARHGVTADEAEEAYNDPRKRGVPAYSTSAEQRWAMLGATADGRVLSLVYTRRGPAIRIITARRRRSREAALPEEVTTMRKRVESLQIVDSLADIPHFNDEGEEAAFWGTHRLSDALLDQMQPLGADVAPPARATKSITLRMDAALLARLQELAVQRQMPYQRLLKQFLQERLQQEEASNMLSGMAAMSSGKADPETVRQTARSIAQLARDLETAVADLTGA